LASEGHASNAEACRSCRCWCERAAGFGRPTGTGHEGRQRRLTVHYARRIFDAQQGIGDQTPNEVIADGIKEIYFQDGGHRARDLEVEFTGIDYIDVSY
jgi:hypothetical protein